MVGTTRHFTCFTTACTFVIDVIKLMCIVLDLFGVICFVRVTCTVFLCLVYELVVLYILSVLPCLWFIVLLMYI